MTRIEQRAATTIAAALVTLGLVLNAVLNAVTEESFAVWSTAGLMLVVGGGLATLGMVVLTVALSALTPHRT